MSPSINKANIPTVYGSQTDVGSVRGHNEDSFVVQSPLFVVADGMGGHEAGEVASALAIEAMITHAPSTPDGEALAQAVCEANHAVIRGAMDGRGKPGMGTTMTAAVLVGNELVVAQVGDSRAYLLHNGKLQRITRDHSLVADYIAQGRLTEEEARYHPQRSVITRALGSDPNMEPDIYGLHVGEGDRLLLCSDGLTCMVEDEGIQAILSTYDNPQLCCNALVQEALAGGGIDNVTVVVVDPMRSEETASTVSASSARAAAQKRRRVHKAPIIWALVFCAVLAAAGVGLYTYINNSYYLMSENNHVNIYRGLPGSFAGIHASWLVEETDVDVTELAPSTANRLEGGIAVDNLDKAKELIASYKETIAKAQAAQNAANANASTANAQNKTADKAQNGKAENKEKAQTAQNKAKDKTQGKAKKND